MILWYRFVVPSPPPLHMGGSRHKLYIKVSRTEKFEQMARLVSHTLRTSAINKTLWATPPRVFQSGGGSRGHQYAIRTVGKQRVSSVKRKELPRWMWRAVQRGMAAVGMGSLTHDKCDCTTFDAKGRRPTGRCAHGAAMRRALYIVLSACLWHTAALEAGGEAGG